MLHLYASRRLATTWSINTNVAIAQSRGCRFGSPEPRWVVFCCVLMLAPAAMPDAGASGGALTMNLFSVSPPLSLCPLPPCRKKLRKGFLRITDSVRAWPWGLGRAQIGRPSRPTSEAERSNLSTPLKKPLCIPLQAVCVLLLPCVYTVLRAPLARPGMRATEEARGKGGARNARWPLPPSPHLFYSVFHFRVPRA